jgi:cystathionine beta-lyase
MNMDFDRILNRRDSDCIKWNFYDEDVLPLWVADMDFISPEPVIRALQERVAQGVFGYGKDPQELREVIVARMAERYGWKVSPEALVFTPGVVVGFNLACHAFVKPGEGALVQTPVYPPFLSAPKNAGIRRDEMELTRQENGRYTVDMDRMANTITESTRLFILSNPHNPVGRVFTRKELEEMANVCLRKKVLICSDEIHGDLIFSGHQHIPIASLSPEIEAQTITMMAPSKTYNIAGLECSVAIIPNPELRKRYEAARGGVVGGVNILGVTAAEAAYRSGEAWLRSVLEYLEGNRDFLMKYVREHLPEIQMAAPEGTYLAWLDCRALPIETSPADFFLQKARVGMNDGADFGRGGQGFCA